MTVYIKPPKGNIPLTKFEEFAKTRLRFLLDIKAAGCNHEELEKLVEDQGHVSNSDCLIEGSRKDNISHFILRLLSAVNAETRECVHAAECALFSYRLRGMSAHELLRALHPLRTLLRRVPNSAAPGHVSSHWRSVKTLCDSMTSDIKWEELVEGFVNKDDRRTFAVPFFFVNELVAKRQVTLHNGMATVSCAQLNHVLSAIFSLVLRQGEAAAARRFETVRDDVRVRRLANYVKTTVYNASRVENGSSCTQGVLRAEQVELYSSMFPPCMLSLHNTLRTHNRLPHQARIAYTLFLKEAGLPVSEALRFWRHFYSQPARGVTWGHDWSTDARRYTYSIRHLYGLEGARRNYRAHCCASMQDMHQGPGQVGGCPFKHFDKANLDAFLAGLEVTDRARLDVLQRARAGLHTAACQAYLLHAANSRAAHLSTCIDTARERPRCQPHVADRSTCFSPRDARPTCQPRAAHLTLCTDTLHERHPCHSDAANRSTCHRSPGAADRNLYQNLPNLQPPHIADQSTCHSPDARRTCQPHAADQSTCHSPDARRTCQPHAADQSTCHSPDARHVLQQQTQLQHCTPCRGLKDSKCQSSRDSDKHQLTDNSCNCDRSRRSSQNEETAGITSLKCAKSSKSVNDNGLNCKESPTLIENITEFSAQRKRKYVIKEASYLPAKKCMHSEKGLDVNIQNIERALNEHDQSAREGVGHTGVPYNTHSEDLFSSDEETQGRYNPAIQPTLVTEIPFADTSGVSTVSTDGAHQSSAHCVQSLENINQRTQSAENSCQSALKPGILTSECDNEELSCDMFECSENERKENPVAETGESRMFHGTCNSLKDFTNTYTQHLNTTAMDASQRPRSKTESYVNPSLPYTSTSNCEMENRDSQFQVKDIEDTLLFVSQPSYLRVDSIEKHNHNCSSHDINYNRDFHYSTNANTHSKDKMTSNHTNHEKSASNGPIARSDNIAGNSAHNECVSGSMDESGYISQFAPEVTTQGHVLVTSQKHVLGACEGCGESNSCPASQSRQTPSPHVHTTHHPPPARNGEDSVVIHEYMGAQMVKVCSVERPAGNECHSAMMHEDQNAEEIHVCTNPVERITGIELSPTMMYKVSIRKVKVKPRSGACAAVSGNDDFNADCGGSSKRVSHASHDPDGTVRVSEGSYTDREGSSKDKSEEVTQACSHSAVAAVCMKEEPGANVPVNERQDSTGTRTTDACAHHSNVGSDCKRGGTSLCLHDRERITLNKPIHFFNTYWRLVEGLNYEKANTKALNGSN